MHYGHWHYCRAWSSLNPNLQTDWQGLADVQLATLNWVDWFNKERVHSALDYVSPFDFEAMYYDKINQLGQVA